MIFVNSIMDKSVRGWIAIPKQGNYSHTFGGNRWTIRDENRVGNGPHLLLNLDLADPRLSDLNYTGMRFLPVCSYVNCDLWVQPQLYTFEPEAMSITFLDHIEKDFFVLPPDLSFEQPLPECPVELREMTSEDLGQTEDDYWNATNDFLGGKSFIRILGPPIWLQDPESAECGLGHAANYFCSIGYEFLEDYGLMGGRPFFIGEGALYFFICPQCKQIIVKSQPS